jgi:hypothetical protein
VGSVVERDDFGLACTLSGFAVDTQNQKIFNYSK